MIIQEMVPFILSKLFSEVKLNELMFIGKRKEKKIRRLLLILSELNAINTSMVPYTRRLYNSCSKHSHKSSIYFELDTFLFFLIAMYRRLYILFRFVCKVHILVYWLLSKRLCVRK